MAHMHSEYKETQQLKTNHCVKLLLMPILSGGTGGGTFKNTGTFLKSGGSDITF